MSSFQGDYTTLTEALQAHGLTPPESIEPGKFYRFPGVDKGASNRAGWCLLFDDGQGAVFGDWSTGLQETWQARKPTDEAERKQWQRQAEKARKKAEQERAQGHQKAAESAADTWAKAEPADTLHGYLVAKEIEAHGLRQQDNNLLVPLQDEHGQIRSLQRIDGNGNKLFHPGGQVKGHYHLIGQPGETLVICEGYATAASIHEATGHPVAVAFNCGNLKSVAETMRRKYPEARIIVAADDDRSTEGNPGIKKATEAAQAVTGALATPGTEGDFNDLHQAQGADMVRERIDQATTPRPRGFQLVRAGSLEVRGHDWLIEDMLERDTLAAYFGPPETWKSLYAIDMCCSVAHGIDFHGHRVKQGNAVYLCGEGFNGLARRFEAWCQRQGIDAKDNRVLVSTQAAQLNDPDTFPLVAATIADAKPDLIVVDTLARNFGPGDENATQDMVRFIAACDRLRTENGCTLALVHHSGLMDRTRGRGNSALKGALDWEYMFTRSGDVVEVECTKVKDAERPRPQAFALDVVTLQPGVTSVTIKETDAPKPAPNTRKGKHQTKALAVLESLMDLHRENLDASGNDPATARVSLNDWRDACMKEKMPRNRWYEVKKTLQDANEIVITPGGFVQLSGCPVSLDTPDKTGQDKVGRSGQNRT